MSKQKIVVIGAGQVGSTTAMRLAQRGLGDIILIDIAEGRAQGKALDIAQSAPVELFNASICGTDDFSAMKNADMVIMTAGFPRKPGMSRADLLSINAKIIKDVAGHIVNYAPNALLISVTNPMDVMIYLLKKYTGFPKERVIGMGGVLDSSRLAYFVSEKLGVACKDINACVIGAHSNAMVPLARYTTVNNLPLTELLERDAIDALFNRTRNAGAEIVGLLKEGSAYYATSSAILKTVLAIIRDEKSVLPCSVYCEGEYGLSGIFCGVPARLNKDGFAGIVQFELTEAEQQELKASADGIAQSIKEVEAAGF